MEAKKKERSEAAETYALFEPDRLKDFIRFVEDRDVTEIEIRVGEDSLRICKAAAVSPAPSSPPQSAGPAVAAAVQAPAPAPVPAPVPAPQAAPAQPPQPAPKLAEITAPLVGTFYSSPSPKDPPFVKIGDTVTKGQTVCIVEAMKVFNNIPSEVDGVVREICAKNEQPVEFGQVLFRVEA